MLSLQIKFLSLYKTIFICRYHILTFTLFSLLSERAFILFSLFYKEPNLMQHTLPSVCKWKTLPIIEYIDDFFSLYEVDSFINWKNFVMILWKARVFFNSNTNASYLTLSKIEFAKSPNYFWKYVIPIYRL